MAGCLQNLVQGAFRPSKWQDWTQIMPTYTWNIWESLKAFGFIQGRRTLCWLTCNKAAITIATPWKRGKSLGWKSGFRGKSTSCELVARSWVWNQPLSVLCLPASPLFSLKEAIKAGKEQDPTSHLIKSASTEKVRAVAGERWLSQAVTEGAAEHHLGLLEHYGGNSAQIWEGNLNRLFALGAARWCLFLPDYFSKTSVEIKAVWLFSTSCWDHQMSIPGYPVFHLPGVEAFIRRLVDNIEGWSGSS